ncbi:MAG: hypothetical protein QNJ01_01160 [Desulfobacterales bacterium]|nr:hypothetical protein [Desulfobacterales bacterium]
MIDSNAIANLQMLMNIGDGRQAVLAELLDAPPVCTTPILEIVNGKRKRQVAHAPPAGSRSPNPIIRGRNGENIRLLQRASHEAGEQAGLSGNIIALLDELPSGKKAPLTAFSEGLAYHYNNLLMAIMGYISIAMPHFRPGHPSRKVLRDCEERIHNAATLIRLLVDVFQRSDQKNTTLYPIDICDHEIGERIFSAAADPGLIHTSQHLELAPRNILQHIADSMATRLLLLMRTLEKEVARALAPKQTHQCIRSYHKRIGRYIRRGVNTAKSLQEFSGRLKLKRSDIDMAALVSEAVQIFQSCFSCVPMRLDLPRRSPSISVDRDLMLKALIELIFTAHQLVAAGDELSIRLETSERGCDNGDRGEQLRLVMTHPVGESFNDDQARQLFDPFRRLPTSGITCRGLELSAASGIIRAHGAHIACRSVDGLMRITVTFCEKHEGQCRPSKARPAL